MVDQLYYGEGPLPVRDAGASVSFSTDLIESVLRDIYDEVINPIVGEYSVDLFKATRDIFSEATANGMARSNFPQILDNEEFLKQYLKSVEAFSAFRTLKYNSVLASMLYDSDGNLRSWEDFKYVTEPVSAKFNEVWLETEYNTAILRGEQAADWQRFERDRDIMPNLRWMPTSSAEPREEHAIFWRMGLTLPVDDPFWNEHHPGDLWNCKCWLEQTTDEPTDEADIPSEADMPEPSKGLKSNSGKTAEMFDKSHPYYPKKSKCPFKGDDDCDGDCNKCPLVVRG